MSATTSPSSSRDLKPDVAFNALHGRYGEDGTVQGVLEFLRIPYTHSGVLASALAMDKHQAKIMFKAAGIPVTDHVIASRAEVGRAHVMPPPYVVKPVADGSSIGIFIVKADQAHPPQEILGADWKGGEELMVERYIPGRELTCAVMGDVALGVTEIVTDLELLQLRGEIRGWRLAAHRSGAECNRKFTTKCRRWPSRRMLRLGAGAYRGRISASTIGQAKTASSSASKSTPSQA